MFSQPFLKEHLCTQTFNYEWLQTIQQDSDGIVTASKDFFPYSASYAISFKQNH